MATALAQTTWRKDNPGYAGQYYRMNKDKWKHSEILRVAYMDSLRASGCVDCGNKNLGVLDFDHLSDKTKGVSQMRGATFAQIDAEASKCEIRCSNCHRLKTAERRKAA